MDALTLRRLIRRLVFASLAVPLAAPVLLSAGCGTTGGPDPSLFSAPACDASNRLQVTGLMPPMPLDYIALRENGFDTGPARILSETGNKCATARDKTTCLSKLDALPATPGFNSCIDHPCEHTLATTQADEVAAARDAAGVVAVLAPIDAPQEAVLVAYANDYDVNCVDRSAGGVRPAPDGDGYEVLASRITKDCAPVETTGYHLKVAKDGTVTVLSQRILSTSSACIGRRPAGLCAPESASEPAREDDCTHAASGLVAIGEYFAAAARLEAASVAAFQVLRDELAAHGAPEALLVAAMQAARDEVRHARVTAELAARYGATAEAPRVDPAALRSLEAIAIENAVEGCVRETFGALVGAFQAEAAQDPEVARAMIEIAEDEARHAALAWQIAAWAEPQLSDAGRARVRTAQKDAVAALRAELEVPVDPSLQALAGVPDPARALVLLEGMAQELWA